MRRKLLLSHLAIAVIVVAVLRLIVGRVVMPELQTLPGGYRQARLILDDLGLFLLVSGLLMALLTYVLVDRFVVRRLEVSERRVTLSARRRGRRDREESLELFRTAFEQSPIGMSLTRLGGDLLRVNPRLCDLLGYTEEELFGVPFQALTHPDDWPLNTSLLSQLVEGERDHFTIEKRYLRKDGSMVWALVAAGVVRDAKGRPKYVVGQVQDISERKRAEVERHESQELFRNAFQESPVGMALARLDGAIVKVNPPFCDMLGYTEAELLTLRFQQFTHPDDLASNLELLDNMRRNQRHHYVLEKRYVRKDGQLIWVQMSVSAVLDAAGAATYMIGHAQDITRRKHDEEELQAFAQRLVETRDQLERRTIELAAKTAEAEAARRVAEEANRIKGVFLANISHEIRTPLAAIIGFANLLRDDRLPEAERGKSVETIARHGQHLLALINDVLDLSKIEADRMTVERIPCDPARLVADVEAMTAVRARDKHLTVTVGVAPGVPRRVRSDPTRLRQVLLNLVSNAIKFTPRGEVRIELSRGDGDDLRLSVADTGIGMSRQQLDGLFQPFGQADASMTRRFGGTGLGLAISKRLVEMMHGRIDVRSEPGVGTTFEVTVIAPACDAAPADAPAAAATPRPGLRVLLAEDGPDNQRLMSFYFEHAAIDYDIAENGRVAVDMALAAEAAGRPFDLVLMDMQMPEMDGYAATAALRANGLRMPVLALTAHGTAEQREQSLRAGCCEHLVKPVEHDQLMAAIAAHTALPTNGSGVLDGRFSDDPAFAAAFAGYVAELPGQVGELLTLSADPADPALRRLLHGIKGAGGGYGLPEVTAAAATAESAVGAGDVNRALETVDALVSVLRSVRGYDWSREAVHATTRSGHR